MVTAALRAWGLEHAQVLSARQSFNLVAHVRVGEQELGLRLAPAVHVYPHGSAEAERSLLEHLAAVGCRVPRVHAAPDGSSSVVVDLPHGPRACMLLDWVPGEDVRRPVSDGDATDLGRLSATLHRCAPEADLPPAGTLDGRRVLTFRVPDRIDEAGTQAPLLRAAHAAAQQGLDEVWRSVRGPAPLLHGDLTPANLVRSPEGTLVPIDFQDVLWGHPAVDVAITLVRIARDDVADGGARCEAFRAGYEAVRTWPLEPAWEPHLRAARSVNLANLALTMRAPGFEDNLEMHLRALRPYVEAL